jgi:hypothetical protein
MYFKNCFIDAGLPALPLDLEEVNNFGFQSQGKLFFWWARFAVHECIIPTG